MATNLLMQCTSIVPNVTHWTYLYMSVHLQCNQVHSYRCSLAPGQYRYHLHHSCVRMFGIH